MAPAGPGWIPAALAQAPGPELFAKEPRTPIELWEAADYLIRTGQARKAVPYLDRFLKGRPDDATLLAVRDRFGEGSFLRILDDPATRPFAQPLVEALAAAARRAAARPDRIAQLVADLTRSPEEQDYAVRRLRESGPYAVPSLVEALRRPGLSAEERRLLIANIGRLDRSAVPPLAAVLESPEPDLAAAAATALGRIGAPEALPFLMVPAASPQAPEPVQAAARAAIARITGRPFDAQPRSPVRVLTDAAWALHRQQVEFPEERRVIWSWDEARKAPVAREVSPAEAATILGLHFARQALRLDPNDRSAQVAQLSLALQGAVDRAGVDALPAREPATFAAATATGPALLADVLQTAVADGKTDLAAAAAAALAKVTDRAALFVGPRPHPLARALAQPGRRLQFTAARGIVALAPDRTFPGSSQLVPTLTRFVVNQPPPRAVVIDGNPDRGARMAGLLMALGYHTELERTGSAGFLAAAAAADVELILVSADLFFGAWNLIDTLANLQADARTAGLPLFVYGPADLKIRRPNLEHDFPGIRFLVPPLEPRMLELELHGRPAILTAAERTGYAREAAALLARIAADPRTPFLADLAAVEPDLAVALAAPETAPAIVAVLSDLPVPDAQRSLAAVVLDPSRPPDFRSQTATRLVHSIKRFGPLLTAEQEARLLAIRNQEGDEAVQAALAAILAALKSAAPAPAPPSPPAPTPAPAGTPVRPPGPPAPAVAPGVP
jgi:hypothetical protein